MRVGGASPACDRVPVGGFLARGCRVWWHRAALGLELRVVEPVHVEVVLGRCSREDREVRLDRVLAEGVALSRRRGGGCAVVVAPGVLVLSCTWSGFRPRYPSCWVEEVSARVAGVLRDLGVKGLQVRPGGDLTVGDRKVMGACLYVGADSAVYGCSLLVNPDLSLLDRFLKHPPREPAYRRGRSHGEFVTSLCAEGFPLATGELGPTLGEALWRLLAPGA